MDKIDKSSSKAGKKFTHIQTEIHKETNGEQKNEISANTIEDSQGYTSYEGSKEYQSNGQPVKQWS